MIELKNIKKVFVRDKNRIEALKDVTLKVNEGDIFGVIGFSGAGKSTLIRIVNYLEKPTEGQVIVNGNDLSKLNNKELRDLRKRIGMIFQHFNLLESKTVYHNIAIPLILNNISKKEIDERVKELLEFVGLADRANAYPSELSGGQKQRVGIARALATNPLVLLCDEATSALDPQTTHSILQLLKKINKEYNITILMITHEMNVIREVCNKVAVIENGEIIEIGRLIEIFGNPQKQTTKNFVRTVVNDRVPESILEQYRGDEKERLLELKFIGGKAKEAVISDASKKNNVEINILYANFTELKKDILGYITVSIKGDLKDIDLAVGYLEDKGVEVREVIR
ncbi:ATP-binding cassette domain-containing protein [Clostridium sp. Sa3CUN1]|uniref:ATP-binding cassette domain-containing protein n=1 Tax=Clostridium gallinarum TaxID=2762246 RepID=A0ABR8PZK7_9CLOT|nr:ATP-binding cassette domain-containing protein [Clostridium gallinarum]MBD7913604.1 ATP-binding cassette domain-containing protein [Clostridium gallinarum]